MSRVVDSNLAGLSGQVFLCGECQRPTPHFTAAGGVPVCGCCGATPVNESHYLARLDQQRTTALGALVYRKRRPRERRSS